MGKRKGNREAQAAWCERMAQVAVRFAQRASRDGDIKRIGGPADLAAAAAELCERTARYLRAAQAGVAKQEAAEDAAAVAEARRLLEGGQR